METKADICFEISWEVCNKVGGIFTVVKSKANCMIDNYKDGYFLIGPYFPKKAFGIFEETVPPEECKPCFEKLKKEGIECHTGKWLIKGEPNVILIDFTNFTKNANGIKKYLWDQYQIDSLGTGYYDFDEPIVWAWAVGKLIEELKSVYSNKKIVAHGHEWLSGAALLYLRSKKIEVGTVFTTHATTLGRTLSSQEVDIYGTKIENPDQEAKNRGPSANAKHLMEKTCAKNANVFTTVSEITGIEAEKLLGVKPQVLLFNGLDIEKFPSFEEASERHKLFKNRIKEFLMYYFFPYYYFDIDNTLIYFIAGRYEFRDKGVDIYIKALGKLNEILIKEKCKTNVVAFFWIPGNVRAIRPELLENKTYFRDLKDSLKDVEHDVINKMLYLLASKQDITRDTLFQKDFLAEIRPKIRRLKRKGNPPLSTHLLFNEDSDAIIQTLKSVGLDNGPEDKVKVIFYPIYLTGADRLLDTSYYESMSGSHLGVFPSYYEPWGYTPLEAAALGVSSVTTDLAGFGRYLCTECEQGKYPGVFVLERYGKKDDDVIQQLTDFMSRFAHYSTKQRIENKIQAYKTAAAADWKTFVDRYIKAHNLAIEKL